MPRREIHWADGTEAQVLEPSEPRKSSGVAEGERFPAKYFNWLLGELSKFQFDTTEELIASGAERGFVRASDPPTHGVAWMQELESAEPISQVISDGEWLWVRRNDGANDEVLEKRSRATGALVDSKVFLGASDDGGIFVATAGGDLYISVRTGTEYRVGAYDRDTLELKYSWDAATLAFDPESQVLALATDGKNIIESRKLPTGQGTILVLYTDTGTEITELDTDTLSDVNSIRELAMDGQYVAAAGAISLAGNRVTLIPYTDVFAATGWGAALENAIVTSLAIYRGRIAVADQSSDGAGDRVRLSVLYPAPDMTLTQVWSKSLRTYALAATKDGLFASVKVPGVAQVQALYDWDTGAILGYFPDRSEDFPPGTISCDGDAIFFWSTGPAGEELQRLNLGVKDRLFQVRDRTDQYRALPSLVEEI